MVELCVWIARICVEVGRRSGGDRSPRIRQLGRCESTKSRETLIPRHVRQPDATRLIETGWLEPARDKFAEHVSDALVDFASRAERSLRLRRPDACMNSWRQPPCRQLRTQNHEPAVRIPSSWLGVKSPASSRIPLCIHVRQPSARFVGAARVPPPARSWKHVIDGM